MRSRMSKGRPGNSRLRTDPLPLSSLFSPLGADGVVEAEDLTLPAPESVRAQKSATLSESGISYLLPKAVVVSGLEHTSAPSQRALMRALAERRVVLDGYDCDETETSEHEPEMDDGTWNLPDGFLMVYVCKSDPHERPSIMRGLVSNSGFS